MTPTMTQNVINNMTPELVQLFNEAGGGALQEFIRQGNELLAGETTQEDAVVSSSRLLGISMIGLMTV